MADEERLARVEALQIAQGEQLARQGEQLARHGEMLARQGETLTRHGEQLSGIRSLLGKLETMIVKIMESQARIEGRIEDMPTARDFGHLEGRVDEIGRRQPVTLAYQPPEPRRT